MSKFSKFTSCIDILSIYNQFSLPVQHGGTPETPAKHEKGAPDQQPRFKGVNLLYIIFSWFNQWFCLLAALP